VQQSQFEFAYEDSLKFHFQYDFLPRSVMPRFIVRMHKDIKDNCRWRTGVLLKGFKATAVVKADNEEKRIHIYVSGEQKRDYFAVIRHTLRDINASFEKLNAVEKVPLPDNDAIAIDYDELTGYEEVGEEYYLVGKLKKRYNVKRLLNGIEKEEDRRLEEANRFGSVKVEGDAYFIETKGNHSSVAISQTTILEKKLEIIIKQLEDSDLPGREELIDQLRDKELKKNKSKLFRVLGEILSKAAEIGTIGSIIKSLL
jgi:hypothetical protein